MKLPISIPHKIVSTVETDVPPLRMSFIPVNLFFFFPNRPLCDRRLETTSYINKSKATTFSFLL